jgi:excisionase family DNA binding protein
MSEKLLTVPEVADYLQVTNARVYELLRQGALPVVRLGRQVRINPSVLQKLVEAGGITLPGGWKRRAD